VASLEGDYLGESEIWPDKKRGIFVGEAL